MVARVLPHQWLPDPQPHHVIAFNALIGGWFCRSDSTRAAHLPTAARTCRTQLENTLGLCGIC